MCEIPKGTNAKMEINKEAEHNSIIQDRKKGKLRFYKYNPEVFQASGKQMKLADGHCVQGKSRGESRVRKNL